MVSSFFVGSYTDRHRTYYSVVMTLLITGACFLAVCGYALDNTTHIIQIWWMLLVIATTVGPLQPVATELGVEIVFPKSENIVSET